MNKIEGITFFDLDGTLLNEHSLVTNEVKQAVTQLKMNNILPVIATGRTVLEIEDIMVASGIDSAIVMNGQFIQVEGKKIYSDEFSYDECKALYDQAMIMGHDISFYNDQKIWCSAQTELLKKAYNLIHSNVPEVDHTGIEKYTVNMMLLLCTEGDEEYLKAFPNLTFYRNSPYSIDTVRKGVSKGTGVHNLLKSLELSSVPTFGFGDGPNDLPLLAACQTKVAMGNARDELKNMADFITKSNQEHGVVHALKHFQLI